MIAGGFWPDCLRDPSRVGKPACDKRAPIASYANQQFLGLFQRDAMQIDVGLSQGINDVVTELLFQQCLVIHSLFHFHELLGVTPLRCKWPDDTSLGLCLLQVIGSLMISETRIAGLAIRVPKTRGRSDLGLFPLYPVSRLEFRENQTGSLGLFVSRVTESVSST